MQTLWRMRDEFVDTHGDIYSVAVVQGDSLSLVELPQLLQGASLFATSKLDDHPWRQCEQTSLGRAGRFSRWAGELDLILVESKIRQADARSNGCKKRRGENFARSMNARSRAGYGTHARTYGIDCTMTKQIFGQLRRCRPVAAAS